MGGRGDAEAMRNTDSSMIETARDPLWRLGHLYHIVDKSGLDVVMTPNAAQRKLYGNMWYRNIVLKARQLGFTTFIDVLALDMAIFRPNWSVVIVAESKDKAGEIFGRKIEYPYDHLPPDLRSAVRAESDSKTGIKFSNGSSVKVMVSARSTTCNFLHVSEYGPVSVLYPKKANEIKTGSFPAVATSGFIFVESTAMGSSGNFFDMVQAAKNRLSQRGIPLSPLEFRLHFFPWWDDAQYRIDSGITPPDRLLRYFDELSAMGIHLDDQQRAWYAAQEAQQGTDMWSEYPSHVDEAFRTANQGAYYAPQFARMIQQERITTVPYEEALPVYTSWDLGMSDDTSIWFFQITGREVRVIDYYANNGEGLAHYVGVLRDKGYRYARHFAPHDIAVRELGSGVSRIETARGMGLNFDCMPTNRDVPGGIEAVRRMLDFCWFDASKTEAGLKALQGYRREWNDKVGAFSDRPLHDWCSHAADAFRTGAVAWAEGRMGETGNALGTIQANPFRVTGGLEDLI